MNSRCIALFRILGFVFIFSFISCTNVVLPQGLSQLGFYGDSGSVIQTLEKKQKLSYTEHFMAGIAYKKNGDYKKAMYHFANSCFAQRQALTLTIYPQPVYRFVSRLSTRSSLYNDAVYEIAKGFMYYQEYSYVLKFIDLIKKEKTGVYRDAQILKSDALIQLKKFEQAKETIEETISQYDDVDSLVWLHLKLASLYEKQDNYLYAVQSYIKLLTISTKSWRSQIAAKRILQIKEKNPYIVLSPDDIIMVVEALYNTKNYSDIVSLDSTWDEFFDNAAIKYEFDSIRIKALCQLGKTGEIKQIYSQYKNSDFWDDCAAVIARTLWNSKKGEAISWVNKLAETTDDGLKKTALYYKALYSIYRKEKNSQPVDEFVANYPNDALSQELLWLYAKNNITNNKVAQYYLEKYYSMFGVKGKYADEVYFWLYILNSKEHPEKAQTILYDLIAYRPDSAYSWIMLERRSPDYTVENLSLDFSMAIQTLNFSTTLFTHAMLTYKERDEAKRLKRAALIKKSFSKISELHYDKIPGLNEKLSLQDISKNNFVRIEHYFSIGYLDGINREFSVFANSRNNDVYMVSYLLGLRYNNYFMSAQALVQLLKRLNLTENIFLMPPDAINSLLPVPFEACLHGAAKKYAVQEPFICAVIKAESLFNPYAESSAGAVGLMQLMLPTAKDIAKKTGYGTITKDLLLKPCISIEMGTYYISWLMKNLNNNITLVAAAYNAGIGNVLQWKHDNEDLFTISVPFAETKGYIERIKKFYYQYMLLYDIRK